MQDSKEEEFKDQSMTSLSCLTLFCNICNTAESPASIMYRARAMYKPVHVLSRKSTRQHRNVFIWCTESQGGFRLVV
jgi:hypothetical protein